MATDTEKTHCLRDHPLDEANLYVSPSGKRECRTCRRELKSGKDMPRRMRYRDGPKADRTWMDDAACRGMDVNVFFPDVKYERFVSPVFDDARATCERCAVREQCLMYAIENGETDGVWGGYSPVQRRDMRQRMMRKGMVGNER